MIKPISKKQLSEIGEEWDRNCYNRQKAIDDGIDISLFHVTAPCILNEVALIKPQKILDVGCGTGYITSESKKYAKKCIGIDISANSILIAQHKYSQAGVNFIVSDFESYCPEDRFDLCISNMALSCDPCYLETLSKINDLLIERGVLLIMIPHPYYWPKYWGFESAKWFDYKREQYIEHDFSITFAKNLGKSTFIHRPLSHYIESFINSGFIIEKLLEPLPIGEIPSNYCFKFPRFMFIKCRKK